MLSFILNKQEVRTDQHPGMVLLEFVRDVACLSGTKEACREGECGACTVLVGRLQPDGNVAYLACASCLLPIGEVAGCHVVTVEGLSGHDLTLVQQLLVDHDASQCGFCTPGIVMSLTGFALTSTNFANGDAVDALDGNLCRCTGYVAIRNAAAQLAQRLGGLDADPTKRVPNLIGARVLPAYFQDLPGRLAQLQQPSAAYSCEAILVAGGTDLFVQKPEQLLESKLCFLSHQRDLDYVKVEDGRLLVGGAVTLESFRKHPAVRAAFPTMEQDLLLHSSTILRNKATLAGNLVNASPIGDMTIILLALDASLRLRAADGGTRMLPVARLFKGYKKLDLACGELIAEIQIPLLPPRGRFNFEKVSNRVYLDIAAVNTACRFATDAAGRLTDLRISVGGVGPVPMLLPGLDAFLGRPLDAATALALVDLAGTTATPIDDLRGSADYKRLLVKNLVRAHFLPATQEVQS